jgi:hypothetical protein
MRIVATAVVSDPLIVLMHMRSVGMASLIAEVAVRAGIVSASHIAAVVIAAVVSSIIRTPLIVGLGTTSRVRTGIVVGASACLRRLRRSRSVGRDVLLRAALLPVAMLAPAVLIASMLIAAVLVAAMPVVLRHAQSAEDDRSCEQAEYVSHVLSPIL